MKATKPELLEYFEQLGDYGTTATGVAHRFGLTPKTADFHVHKLEREGLIERRTHQYGRHFKLSPRGQQRLAYYRGETTGGTIKIV